MGTDKADEAADYGRRRVHERVIDARRHLSGVCGLRCPVVRDLHRFFIAIARAAVKDDDLGGTAIDPCVWSAGSVPKRRKVQEGAEFCCAKWSTVSLGGELVMRFWDDKWCG